MRRPRGIDVAARTTTSAPRAALTRASISKRSPRRGSAPSDAMTRSFCALRARPRTSCPRATRPVTIRRPRTPVEPATKTFTDPASRGRQKPLRPSVASLKTSARHGYAGTSRRRGRMVDFELTDEQKLMQKVAHEFAEREMRPVALDYDKKGTVPWEVVQKAHDIQLDTAFIPEAYGGGGVTSTLTHVVVMEELNWGCAGIATGLIGAGLAYLPIIHMGTEDQKKRLLTRFTGPEARFGALCLTEPDAGSDVANLSTTARRDAGEWVLNGTKRFITNGGIADVHVVFATVDKSLGYFGIRAFAVEKGTPGLRMGKVEDKMGVRASHPAEGVLEDCRVPLANMLPSHAT